MRTLYFDIDGVLLSYDDEQRPLLVNGELQNRLKKLSFTRLVCVSGWSDIFNAEVLNKSERNQKFSIHSLLNDVFPDKEWFIDRLVLAYDTDHRGQHIDLSTDWFYIDDWADKFFCDEFGQTLYESEVGRRILLVDPHGDGSDILHWLDNVVVNIGEKGA